MDNGKIIDTILIMTRRIAMDMREMKTKRSITNAFLEIRSKKPLERITVRELCERAEVSKGTFYLHYHDIYELSDMLQENTIKSILGHVEDPVDMVYNPRKSSKEMIYGFYANREVVNILFNGSQFSRLPEKIEAGIKDILFEKFPEFQDDVYANIRLTYQLMGAFYAFYKYENEFGFDAVFAAVDRITTLFELPPKDHGTN